MKTNKPLLKKYLTFLIPVILIALSFPVLSAKLKPQPAPILTEEAIPSDVFNDSEESLNSYYDQLQLSALGLTREAFNHALSGYEYLKKSGKVARENILTIADFSLPSSKKRLFVLDMEKGELLFHTYVAHGRNSGKEFAKQFSNQPESFKSSPGFYITKNTYFGKHGFSLRLEGKEKGINDNAMKRAIVMHAADYVNPGLVKTQGYIGRSLGCPALPNDVYKPILNEIKEGSVLFIYSNEDYAKKSPVLQLAAL